MPKVKTKRAAAKRFSVTGTGRVNYGRSFGAHILTTKSRKRKRRLRKNNVLSNNRETNNVKRLIPYL